MSGNNHALQQKNRKTLIQNCLFFTILIITGCFLFWKCRYGFANIDESFYLTVPYRLYQGDALFREEWNLSQMAGFLTFPIVALYVEIIGTTEGIVLAMRYVWTLIQCTTAVFLYFRLKKYNWLGAAVAAMSYVLYTPFGIMAMSYNSMGILFLLLSLVILLTAEKRKNIQYAVAGLSFAAAVLCCPSLLLIYVLYLAAVAVLKYVVKNNGLESTPWSVKSAVCFTAGAAALAVVFAVFVLSRSSLKSVLEAFPYIFDDPQHSQQSLVESVLKFVEWIAMANSVSATIYGFLVVVWLVCLLDKKRECFKTQYISILSAGILALMISYYRLNHYINYVMWSVNVCVPFILLLSVNKQIRKIAAIIWIPGILYGLCINIVSNQKFYAISSASSVATVGSLLIIVMYTHELIKGDYSIACKRMMSCCFCLLVCFQIATQVVMRYESVFWEADGMDSLTMKADRGTQKGIIMSEESFNMYQNSLAVVDRIQEYNSEKVLYLSKYSWYYLEGMQEMATYSAWIAGVDSHSLYSLGGYYELNPHKIPDIVYSELKYEETAMAFCEQFGYEAQIINGGIILLPK